MSPIALGNLTLQRLTAFVQLALRALPLAFRIVGEDALALVAPRGVAGRDLGLPIRTGAGRHNARSENRRCRWWPRIDRAAVAPRKWQTQLLGNPYVRLQQALDTASRQLHAKEATPLAIRCSPVYPRALAIALGSS